MKVYTISNTNIHAVSKPLSLKLQEELFQDMEEIIKKNKTPRNRYINEAIRYYNQFNERKLLKLELKQESLVTAPESLRIMSEFEAIEDEFSD